MCKKLGGMIETGGGVVVQGVCRAEIQMMLEMWVVVLREGC